ncbi:Hydrogen peroxide-inducible genes activator [Roseovarius albus]|uniref:Hydrogen peroxide-inducible genes activator n=1 Tax=Roseovarius albus TaxID=1247867 RepID=A0A1X7ABT5_9RHOB|nr:hydrogen peroxide-inducible genes activator [Roseovarius albus]SLN73725.1 Hydrogen peroxide-inducible genes activator [Roseovarius albus]
MTTNKITLKQLRYLVAVADQKHFRRAAELCDVSQPSLSVQIQNLEEELGVLLVERGRGEVLMTPAGREVVDRARSVLVDVQGIADFATYAQQGLTGTIRLGVQATLGPYLLPLITSALHREHPDFKLYIRECVPSRLESELANGIHDVILAKLPLRSSDLVATPLFREPILLTVSRDHPLAVQEGVSIKDLENLPVLSLAPDFHLHDQVHALCEEFGANIVHDYVGTSLDALRQMVAMDMGTTFVPALYAKSEIPPESDVVALPLKGRRVFRSIGLVWRKGAGRAQSFRDLAQFIQACAKSDFPELELVDAK